MRPAAVFHRYEEVSAPVTSTAIVGGSLFATGGTGIALMVLAESVVPTGTGGDWIKFLSNAGSLGVFVAFAGMLLWFQWKSRTDEIRAAEKKDEQWRAFCKTLVDEARRDVVAMATLSETNRQRGHEAIKEVTNALGELRLLLMRIGDRLDSQGDCDGGK